MKKIILTLAAGLLITACHRTSTNNDVQPQNNSSATTTHTAAAKSLNGVQGAMPAYYDGNLFKVNFKQMTDQSAQNLIAHNGSINVIYESDPGLPGGQMFIAVLDAIQGDGFNPLWQEFQIVFNPGHTPHQLFSDTEIADSAAAGVITVTPTDEVYRCSVIGKP